MGFKISSDDDDARRGRAHCDPAFVARGAARAVDGPGCACVFEAEEGEGGGDAWVVSCALRFFFSLSFANLSSFLFFHLTQFSG